jgi:hypothetical protein
MSKKSRRAQRRRRQRRREGGKLKPIDVLNVALGEFLTACGEVEFKMILFADRINEAGIERIFAELSGPFGPKIKAFKDWCDLGGVSDVKKPILQRVYKGLDDLLPIRNFLVHGETWHGRIKGGLAQPYRVGIIKKELDYMDKFERGEHSNNVFSTQQVRAATDQCRNIIDDLNTLLS